MRQRQRRMLDIGSHIRSPPAASFDCDEGNRDPRRGVHGLVIIRPAKSAWPDPISRNRAASRRSRTGRRSDRVGCTRSSSAAIADLLRYRRFSDCIRLRSADAWPRRDVRHETRWIAGVDTPLADWRSRMPRRAQVLRPMPAFDRQ
jgi:hypothetical protein